MTVTLAKWTIDEYHQMIESGILTDRRVELLLGEIVEMPSEGVPHASMSDETAEYLRQVLGHRARVRTAHPVTLPNHSEPEPDLAIVAPLPEIYRQHHPYPENIFWLIEYADTSLKQDVGVKQTAYATAGIQEYWVVNLQALQLIVFRHPSPRGYESEMILTEGTIAPLAFPEVEIAVQQLFNLP
jgi:Uma2 family endonuclease